MTITTTRRKPTTTMSVTEQRRRVADVDRRAIARAAAAAERKAGVRCEHCDHPTHDGKPCPGSVDSFEPLVAACGCQSTSLVALGNGRRIRVAEWPHNRTTTCVGCDLPIRPEQRASTDHAGDHRHACDQCHGIVARP